MFWQDSWLTQKLPVALVFTDSSAKITALQNCQPLFDLQDIIGKRSDEILPLDDHQRMMTRLRLEAIAMGQIRRADVCLSGIEFKKRRPCHVMVLPIFNPVTKLAVATVSLAFDQTNVLLADPAQAKLPKDIEDLLVGCFNKSGMVF